MRYLASFVFIFLGVITASAGDNTNSTFSTLLIQDNGKTIIQVKYNNLVYQGYTNFVSTNVALNLSNYTLVRTNGAVTNTINSVTANGLRLITNNQVLIHSFTLNGAIPYQTYNLYINYPGTNFLTLISATNASWWSEVFGPMSFTISPFNASGNDGGLGIQYQFVLDTQSYSVFENLSKSNSSPWGWQRKFEITSQGQFGVGFGNSSNNVEDNLNAEADFKGLLNYPFNGNIYSVGLLASPAGFEWNSKFSLGSYTPKIALGGSVPLIDTLAIKFNKWLMLTNAFTSPTLFSGITYVGSLATNGLSDAAAAKVHARWDTEFIYEMPLYSNPSIKLSELALRFTWDSYVGVDHSLWKQYYQAGLVWYFSNYSASASNAGVFAGYTGGEQAPTYDKTDYWQIGATIKF